jgi:hypothetical protein
VLLGGRAGCLKAFPNAMESYHMSIVVQFTAEAVGTSLERLSADEHGIARKGFSAPMPCPYSLQR